MKKGYLLFFKDNACIICDPHGLKVAQVQMIGDSFPLIWDKVRYYAYSTKNDETWLWHKRYGHFNLRSLKCMQLHELARNISKIQVIDDICRC